MSQLMVASNLEVTALDHSNGTEQYRNGTGAVESQALTSGPHHSPTRHLSDPGTRIMAPPPRVPESLYFEQPQSQQQHHWRPCSTTSTPCSASTPTTSTVKALTSVVTTSSVTCSPVHGHGCKGGSSTVTTAHSMSNVEHSYHTTSSPASTSSNYHLHQPNPSSQSSQSHHNQSQPKKTIKESIESKRERKAAKILAIITGK